MRNTKNGCRLIDWVNAHSRNKYCILKIACLILQDNTVNRLHNKLMAK